MGKRAMMAIAEVKSRHFMARDLISVACVFAWF
jgi:tellurite resistance protein